MSPRSIYFVAGEASADNHGAALLASLREIDADFHFLGRGGPRMQAIAGGNFKNWIDEAAVVGLWEVIKRYGYFRKQFGEALNEIVRSKPDAVVLIDYPGFNLRLARRLHFAFAKAADSRQSVPKIIYYISPQVWAWNRRRIKQMAQQLDLMLCIFPFEADLYNQSGLRTIFVGHPMIDSLPEHKSGRRGDTDSSRGEIDKQRDPDLVALLPGSRGREVRKILPILLEVASTLRKTKPRLRFEIAAASPALAAEMRQMLDRFALDGRDQPSFEVRVGEAAALMQRAFAGIVASGSATLEATYFRMPFVLVYKVAWLTYFAARFVVKVKYLGMPNVLANKEVVPEFIQHRATSRAIAEAVARLLDNDETRRQMIFEFDAIAGKLGQGGASARAARAICGEISR